MEQPEHSPECENPSQAFFAAHTRRRAAVALATTEMGPTQTRGPEHCIGTCVFEAAINLVLRAVEIVLVLPTLNSRACHGVFLNHRGASTAVIPCTKSSIVGSPLHPEGLRSLLRRGSDFTTQT